MVLIYTTYMNRSEHRTNSIHVPLILFVLIVVGVGLPLLLWPGSGPVRGTEQSVTNVAEKEQSTDYPEVAELAQHQQDWQFKQVQTYFQNLAQQKGGEYAYTILRLAPLPPNMDLHLLGHVIGDVLYKQEGVQGMRLCTQDFRNACSHAIVVGLFGDQGEAALTQIIDACKKAPGGSGAYTMCFHGLGHGVFAALGYDVAKTVPICAKAGATPGAGSPEAVECMGGMIMELMGGGDHDRELWAKKRQQYVSDAQPLRPCSDDIIPVEAKYMCYVYLTPHLFQVAGADLGKPLPEHFKKAFTYCEALPQDQKANRDACFGGFGKEFVVLAQDRDIRQQSIQKVTDAQLSTIYNWCTLSSNKDGAAACVLHAMNSLYWGGENPRSLPIRFCGLVTDSYLVGSCYIAFFSAVNQYNRQPDYHAAVCSEVPTQWQQRCKEQLHVP